MKKLISLLLILALLVANGLIPAFAENDRHVSELRIGTTAEIDGFSLMT